MRIFIFHAYLMMRVLYCSIHEIAKRNSSLEIRFLPLENQLIIDFPCGTYIICLG
jgi:hypothetical protein